MRWLAAAVERLAWPGLTHPRWTLAAGLVVFVLATLWALPPRADPDLLKLLPDDLPAYQAIEALGKDRIPAGLQLTLDGPADAVDAAVPALAARLESLDEVAYTLHRLEPDLALHVGLMQLPPDDVAERARLLDAALLLGRSRPPMMTAELADVPAVEPDLQALLPDDDFGRIFVRPSRPHHDPRWSRQVVDAVRATADEVLPPDVELIYLAGPYAVVADGAAGIQQDLLRTGGLSLLLVLGVVVVGLRSLRAPVLLFPPLLLAALLQLALVQAFLGAVNGQTVMGTAVLFGLGVDFAIHLIARVREGVADGLDRPGAIRAAWRATGPVNLFAALTTAAGFSVLGLARFGGLAQLGLTLTLGVGLSLLAVLVVLPALLMLVGPGRPRTTTWRLPAIPPVAARVGLGVVVVLLALSAVSAWSFVHLEHDFTALGRDAYRMDALSDVQRALTRQAVPPALVRVTDETRAATQAELRAHIEAGDLPHVRAVLSVDDLLPPDQARRVELLGRLRAGLDHPSARYLPPPALAQLERLRDWEPRVRTLDDLPEGLRSLFGDGSLLLLPLQGELHDMRESGALLDELAEHAPGAASEIALQGALYRLVLGDLPWLSAAALLLVGALTLISLRHPGRGLLALTALLGGLLAALGVVGLLGLPLTLANLIGLPILLGMGIDVVLHLVERLERDGLEVAVRTVAPPAALSTLTTVASFVSLSAASTGGLRSLGQLVTVGLLVGTSVAFLLVVLVHTAFRRTR